MKKRILPAVLTVTLVTLAVLGGFALGARYTMKCAVPVGPATSADNEPGYLISYRYGGLWFNEFYPDGI